MRSGFKAHQGLDSLAMQPLAQRRKGQEKLRSVPRLERKPALNWPGDSLRRMRRVDPFLQLSPCTTFRVFDAVRDRDLASISPDILHDENRAEILRAPR